MAVGENSMSCAELGAERETTVDQALIRGLVTAFRSRLGAFLGLEDGRRARSPATSLVTGVPDLSCSAPALHSEREVARYAGATSRPIAHRKAAISRAIAATTTGGFLPTALRRR